MTDLYLSQSEFQDIFKNHLKIEVYSKPIESLFSIRSRKKIDYSPYYQRNYVWDEGKASYFIESIVLGTEIPPLIFFNNGGSIEVIDGRQRFETLARFFDGELTLKRKGLGLLKQLDRQTFKSLSTEVLEVFLTSTLRIIEFEIVNEPRLDPLLQDKVKKEIFSRYNSGITPLKKAEVETAVYIDDEVTQAFKDRLDSDSSLNDQVERLFFRANLDERSRMKNSDALSFIRRMLVQYRLPVTYYAQGKKQEVLKRLYQQLGDSQDEPNTIVTSFAAKVTFVDTLAKALVESGVGHNRLVNECLLWALFVIENEGQTLPAYPPDAEFVAAAIEFFSKNLDSFDETDRHFYGPVVKRYNAMADFFEGHCPDLSLHVYRAATDESKDRIRELLDTTESSQAISEMESLRLNKPDPTRLSIEDISKQMTRRKFLVRPPYQRSEVINLPKASAIIESILLGIPLPVIFVFKRANGISEVIDGQQRLLTILGFIQEGYMDERGDSTLTRNHGFKLRNPKILTEFKGAAFLDLPEDAQDRIMDFQLFVVTIEERLNPAFDPVDLFIRLNDKPYPIKEHSFEMWNSWVDKDIITSIRKISKRNLGWLYIRIPTQRNFRDRMENEEALAVVSYLSDREATNDLWHNLDVYQKDDRLNARVKGKKNVTLALNKASDSDAAKAAFLAGVKTTRSVVKKLRLILLDRDIEEPDALNAYLEQRFNQLCHPDKTANVRRAFQDYYVLWLCLEPLSFEMTQLHRIEMFQGVQAVFRLFRSVPDSSKDGVADFFREVTLFHSKYAVAERKTRLSESDKASLIKEQGNECSITGAPLFVGDDIHVDHTEPLAAGGEDDPRNLGASHPNANLRKGGKSPDE